MLLDLVDLLEPQNSYSRKIRRYSVHEDAVVAPEAAISSASCFNDVRFCEDL